MSAELWRKGASEIAMAIAKHEITSREVIEAHLDRIEEVNGNVNAITLVLTDAARQAAEAADKEVAEGNLLGPLHGVPFSVKENIDLLGTPTTHGVAAFAQSMPTLDSPFIARAKAAGGIPLSRTNLPDFALRFHTYNALRGATLNPWDSSRSPGGSSGGEGAALATGMSPLGFGNDLGGSVRIPAQFCGITALKPSFGRVPHATSIEPTEVLPPAFQMMYVDGPMARHVRDLRLAFETIAGTDPRDPWSVPVPLNGPEVPRPIRVALCTNPGGADVHQDVAAAVRTAAEVLAGAGYEIDEVAPPRLAEASQVFLKILRAETQAMIPLMIPLVSEEARQTLGFLFESDSPADVPALTSAWAARQGIARTWSMFLVEHPLVLGPVMTHPAFEVGYDLGGAEAADDLFRRATLTVAANFLGLPSVAVPTGVAGGLPQGVQLIGARYREDLCLDAAETIEERLGVLTPIDQRN